MKPQYAATGVNWGCLLIPLIVILVGISFGRRIVRYFREMSDERRRLRIEVSKLAHELEALRSERGDKAKEAREPTA